jgi:hypothetical protein
MQATAYTTTITPRALMQILYTFSGILHGWRCTTSRRLSRYPAFAAISARSLVTQREAKKRVYYNTGRASHKGTAGLTGVYLQRCMQRWKTPGYAFDQLALGPHRRPWASTAGPIGLHATPIRALPYRGRIFKVVHSSDYLGAESRISGRS